MIKKRPASRSTSLLSTGPGGLGQRGLPRGALGKGIPASFRANLKQIDWTDLELFLNVAEAGSIRAGAIRTRRAINTVRNRLARMEDVLGELIARRGRDGLQLTQSGQALLRIAREMHSSRQSAAHQDAESGQRMRVRIAATEGLGTYWLTPRILEFQAATQLRIELHCDMQRVDMAEGDFDIAVQLEQPEVASSLCFRLGTLHLMPFASDKYLREAGVPQSVDDWPDHRLVWQEADQVASQLLPFFVGTVDTGDLISLTTNSSLTHFRAVAAGGGIGFLPTYARAISRLVRPIDIGVHLKREILCVLNPARAKSPEVERAVDWLTSAFSGEKYPWFRDEFVHPRDFDQTATAANVTSLFEGYIDGLDASGDT
jgi:DNA-binding transcriptional LysR family regulator